MDYNKATGEFVLQLAKLSMGLHVLHVQLTESHTFARASRVKLISVEDPLVFSEKMGRKVVTGVAIYCFDGWRFCFIGSCCDISINDIKPPHH